MGGQVDGQDDIELVEAARAGDPIAFGRLFDRWFDRTYDVSWHIVRNPDTAAEIAQDSFVAAWEQLPTLRQPGSFGGWILRIARNRSLNRLERDRRSSPRDGDTVTAVLDGRTPQADIASGVADHDRDQLVWAAAAALGERDTSLLDLHLRHDLGAAAIAEELDITPNNAHQLLYRLRGRLAGAIRSWVLWRDGRSRCLPLADAIGAAQVTHFGAEAVRAISAHAADCEVCREAQQAVLAPEALFAATPLVGAPLALKAQAAAGLMSAGVPVGTALSRAAAAGGGDGLGGAAGERTIILRGNDDGGPGDGSDGGGTSPAGDASAEQASSRRRSLLAAAVVALLLLLGGAVALSAQPASDDETAITETRATADDDAANDDEVQVFGTDEPADTPGAGDADGSASLPGGSTTTTAPDSDSGSGGTGDPDGPGEPGGGGSPATTTSPGGSSGSSTTAPVPPDPVPDPDVDPPEILRFQSVVTGTCGDQRALRSVTLIWASQGGESATLGPVGGAAQSVAPSGSAGPRCVLLGEVYLLTVSGPGGIDSSQLTIAV